MIDEFTELLQHHPDFVELFGAIGRLGRSLGVHLLLASQRLDEGRIRGLDSHLSYRISPQDPDHRGSHGRCSESATRPNSPATRGAALLRSSEGTLTRFQTIYVGAPNPIPAASRCESVRQPVSRFTSHPAAPVAPAGGATPSPTLLDTVVDRLRGRGSRARHLAAAADRITGTRTARTYFGSRAHGNHRAGRPAVRTAPPAADHRRRWAGRQRRGGRRTAGREVGHRLHHRHGPGIAPRSAPNPVVLPGLRGGALHPRRAAARRVVSRPPRPRPRSPHRRSCHLGSARPERLTRDDGYGDVFLVIDGWAVVREDFAELEPAITAIAAQGLSHGVHLLITAGRWADIRPGLRDQFGTRIELRLGDPLDSEMDRKQAALVPADRPGSGITGDGHHFVVARSHPGLVTADRTWTAPPVRLLPPTPSITTRCCFKPVATRRS